MKNAFEYELEIARLIILLKDAEKVIDQFMPNVGKCYGIDYELLNETLCALRGVENEHHRH